MKTLPTALAAHIATRSTTLAYALRITRTDGVVFGFTSHDQDATIDGVIYRANPGVRPTDIVVAANASVGNLELTTLHDGTTFTTAAILGGIWRNAAFFIFRYNWKAPADGNDILLAGTMGECQILQNTVVAELRDLRQYLQQAVGDSSSKTCRARLGDARCKKDLTGFTYESTITGISNNRIFTDSARTQAPGWFDEGELLFLSGANVGQSVKIKTFTGGVFTLVHAASGPVEIGDAYRAIAGCRKRLEEDCRDKYDNVVNFIGEPHRQGVASLIKSAAQ